MTQIENFYIKNILLSAALITIFFSCSPGNERNEILLYNNLYFNVLEGELEKDKTPVVERYTAYFNNQNIQIPLLKYIHHEDYEVFIGIPVNATIKELADDKKDFLDIAKDKIESDSNYYYTNYKMDEYFIAEYSSYFGNESMFYISAKTKSKELFDSLFDKISLSKRIELK